MLHIGAPGQGVCVSQSLEGCNIMVKKELSCKVKLLIYQSAYIPSLTHGCELWLLTTRTRSQFKASEIRSIRRVAGLSLRDSERSSGCSLLRWFAHLAMMPLRRLPLEAFWACPCGWRPWGRPRARWRGLHTAAGLGAPQGPHRRSEKVLLVRSRFRMPCWACCQSNPAGDEQKKKDGWVWMLHHHLSCEHTKSTRDVWHCLDLHAKLGKFSHGEGWFFFFFLPQWREENYSKRALAVLLLGCCRFSPFTPWTAVWKIPF